MGQSTLPSRTQYREWKPSLLLSAPNHPFGVKKQNDLHILQEELRSHDDMTSILMRCVACLGNGTIRYCPADFATVKLSERHGSTSVEPPCTGGVIIGSYGKIQKLRSGHGGRKHDYNSGDHWRPDFAYTFVISYTEAVILAMPLPSLFALSRRTDCHNSEAFGTSTIGGENLGPTASSSLTSTAWTIHEDSNPSPSPSESQLAVYPSAGIFVKQTSPLARRRHM